MSTTPKLKPCPFCGDNHPQVAEDEYSLGGDDGETGYGWFAYCNSTIDCFAKIGPYNTREEAIAAWNRRAKQPKEETK